MQLMKYFIYLMFVAVCFSCSKQNDVQPTPDNSMYFPSNTDTSWERASMATLGWNQGAVQPLKDYLNAKHTKSFMILVNGRIVMEEYFNGHNSTAPWEWNSAGKSLVSAAVGIAQQKGYLNINDKVSTYLGAGWSSEPLDKEILITIKNLLSMTSGLNDTSNLVIPANLTYVADAGTRWSYSNVFQLLMDVVAAASNQTYDNFFSTNLKSKIGMDGLWNYGVIFKIYYSNTRSMARYGLLALNKGKWKNEQVINEAYFTESTNSSQSINPSYGYLWWLNGKSNFMIPGAQIVFPGPLVPNAPADMFAAMGASDQRAYVIPSKNMVVIRMGDASDPANPTFAVSGFDNEMWAKINAVIQ